MQPTRSLFLAAFKDPRQPIVRGVSRSRPFVNAWAPAAVSAAAGAPSAPCPHPRVRAMSSATTFYDFKPLDKKGQPVPLSEYKDKVVLVVNTASKCGFTPQYEPLEKLYQTIREQHPDDFQILGFPCNQFGGQEPASDDDIQEFCRVNYGVSFPVLGKTDVNGDKAAPLYDWLKSEKPGLMGLKRIKWNFEKFLIGRDGKVVERWASTKNPLDLEGIILKELAKGQKAEL